MLLPLGMWFVMLMAVVGIYALRSFGLYRMAKNTAMPNPWLAWVPVAHEYLAGKMADRFTASQGKKTRYAFWMLLCYGLFVLSFLLFMGAVMFFAIGMVAFESIANQGAAGGILLLVALLAMYALLLLGALAATVLRIVAHYYLYRDFEPNNTVLYTVLTVFGLDFICKLLIKDNVPVGIAGRYPHGQPKYKG